MNRIDSRKIIGRRIERLLDEQHKPVRQWAQVLGKTPANCYAILAGRQNIMPDDLILTSEFLEVTADYLLRSEEEIPIYLRLRPGETRESVAQKIMTEIEEFFRQHPEADPVIMKPSKESGHIKESEAPK
jgi:hypothetical protein